MSEVPAGAPTVESVMEGLPAKPRVHELAKRIGVGNKELIARLADLGVTVSSSSASVPRAALSDLLPGLLEALLPAAAAGGTEPAAAPPARPVADDAIESPAETTDEAAGGVLFLPPQPARRRRGRGKAADQAGDQAGDQPGERATVEAVDAAPEAPDTGTAGEPGEQDQPEEQDDSADAEGGAARGRRRRRGRRGRGRAGSDADSAEQDSADRAAEQESAEQDTADADGGQGTAADTAATDQGAAPEKGQGKGRRRGGRSGAVATAEPAETAEGTGDAEATDEDDTDEDAAEGAGGTRRRRRRRRRATGDESAREDDPDNTVVHVRESRPSGGSSEVQGVRGSTRLEAKRQRRRDSRESRRRPQILSEAEFLARRESVERVMAVRQRGDLAQVALLEDGVLVEHFVSKAGTDSMIGSVFLGRVQNVLPSMEAAFVDIGRGRNAVLYAGEVNWDAAGLAGKARRIETALSSGDTVLAQVSKDPVGHKGARLTTQISLPGRFLVYVPGGGATGISRKLPDTERKRLKGILDRIVPSEAGVIIRTAAEGIAEEDLVRDVERLKAQWEDISGRAGVGGRKGSKGGGGGSAPTQLSAEPGTLIKVIRDLFNSDISRLVVDGDEAYAEVSEYVTSVAPELADRLSRYESNGGASDVFTGYRVDEQIAKALERKVHLPSGGSLVIDRTEAMTVVDVNTGKFTGSGGNLEETVTKNNLEAAEEIVRQLRLRDIGGIIVVDFIDMVLESNRELVLRRLTECLGRDRSRHQVAEVTSLGLVQMTRKRMGTGLLEAFSEPCPHCGGRGVLLHDVPVAGSDDGGAAPEPRTKGRRSRARGSDVSEDVVARVQHTLGRRPDPRGPKPPPSVGPSEDDGAAAEAGDGDARRNRSRRSGPPPTEAAPEALAEPVTAAGSGEPELTVPQPEPGPDGAEQRPESGAAAAPGPEAAPAEASPDPAQAAASAPAVSAPPEPPKQPAPRRRRAASRPAGPAGEAVVADIVVPADSLG